jgi:hypothetical protein
MSRMDSKGQFIFPSVSEMPPSYRDHGATLFMNSLECEHHAYKINQLHCLFIVLCDIIGWCIFALGTSALKRAN